MTEERWLTLQELCVELRLSYKTVHSLIAAGKLFGIGGISPKSGRKRIKKNWRFLSPTPKYRQMLETEEKILAQRYKANLLATPLLSAPDFAAVVGIAHATVRGLIHERKLEPHKIGRYSYFTVEQVRDFLLRRERKEPTSRRVRCETLIRWCLAQLEANPVDNMTRDQVRNDDLLEGHLHKLLLQREPNRSLAIREFWRRYQLAKDVATVIASSNTGKSRSAGQGTGSSQTPDDHIPD